MDDIDNKKLFMRQDQHFLNYPLWTLNERLKPFQKISISTENGEYTLVCGEKSPNHVDGLFLFALMKLAQAGNKKTLKILNRSEILKMCNLSVSTSNYKRLWISCERWRSVTAKFDGCYYDTDEKKYVSMVFGIIEWAKFDKTTKELKVKFNDIFYKTMKEAKLYRLIDLNHYRMLRRPVSKRLYELLKKQIEVKIEWKIEINELIKKLTLSEKYPSQVIKKLKPAICEINRNTELYIVLKSYKSSDKRTIFCFKKTVRFDRLKNTKNSANDSIIGKRIVHKHADIIDIIRKYDGLYFHTENKRILSCGELETDWTIL